MSCAGAVSKNINRTRDKIYEVRNNDYTILCDAEKNPITVVLPPACNHRGRILNIKKTNTDKYNLRSHPVKLKVSEGAIDFKEELINKSGGRTRDNIISTIKYNADIDVGNWVSNVVVHNMCHKTWSGVLDELCKTIKKKL